MEITNPRKVRYLLQSLLKASKKEPRIGRNQPKLHKKYQMLAQNSLKSVKICSNVVKITQSLKIGQRIAKVRYFIEILKNEVVR